MNTIHRLQGLGQSIWLDNIQRNMLNSGELQRLIVEDGVTGVTSNPTIFEKAIGGSNDYDAALAELQAKNPDSTSEQLFFDLAIEDIQAAADLLRPVYESSNARDGMVSLEVSPTLAYDSEATFKEGLSLWQRVNRPNLMIKVPSTREGLVAIEKLTASGVNVNATLLFSLDRYRSVAEAFLLGLEERLRSGQPINRIESVASFFISRVDAVIDGQLQGKADDLMGKAAIANAKLAYENYMELFTSERFIKLRESGASTQRLLWASTGTKSPDYSDVLYIDSLIGAETVNTVPPATLTAFLDHGNPQETLAVGFDEARQVMAQVADAGVDVEVVTTELEQQGVDSFAGSFSTLLEVIEGKLRAIGASTKAHG